MNAKEKQSSTFEALVEEAKMRRRAKWREPMNKREMPKPMARVLARVFPQLMAVARKERAR